eukprot:CAMPEP_0201974928 /NCGR_PEP_ID=MMETSP0904-20121228/52231_1 /ASSEMBLY_ACC=CAM_ASM_000553 /TAXON_ID=420261 /ORGANISM="Thalassiosira antarctica, Strain CCMP982" /LENGTH=38 /DNA_ID= /DNA_START= /DNA_END= /DNA_ORIENTATION=
MALAVGFLLQTSLLYLVIKRFSSSSITSSISTLKLYSL